MILQSISILNFRNLEPVSSGFGKGFWVVLGANGQGKSNFLEAIHVLCMGRSRRTDRDKDLIRSYEKWFSVNGKFIREERGSLELSVRITPEGKKELSVFGTQAQRLASYVAEAACVMFTSEDVEVILGDPSGRRLFLNEALSQTSQGYLFDLARYRRALDQKRSILRDVRERLASVDSLDIWDQQLADYGGRVCARRERYLRMLNREAGALYERLSGAAEEMTLEYHPSVRAPEALEQWPDAMAQALREKRPDEVARGITLVGPQRDDILIKIRNLEARSFASRGQARTAALALRLAQARIAKEQTGEWPLILMDDVFAELDADRRGLLAEVAMEAEQVFASAASLSDLPDLGEAVAGRILVSAGQLQVENA